MIVVTPAGAVAWWSCWLQPSGRKVALAATSSGARQPARHAAVHVLHACPNRHLLLALLLLLLYKTIHRCRMLLLVVLLVARRCSTPAAWACTGAAAGCGKGGGAVAAAQATRLAAAAASAEAPWQWPLRLQLLRLSSTRWAQQPTWGSQTAHRPPWLPGGLLSGGAIASLLHAALCKRTLLLLRLLLLQ